MPPKELKIEQPDIPKLQQFPDPGQESSFILFRDMRKSLSNFLLPRDTDDANDGTFVALNNTPAIQFADAATRVAYFILVIPTDLRVGSMEFIWSTSATTGNLRWQVDIGEGGPSTLNNARTTGGTAVSTAADSTANNLTYTNILTSGAGVNISTLVKSNLWGIKFSRLGAAAEDTLSTVANLYGLLIRYI